MPNDYEINRILNASKRLEDLIVHAVGSRALDNNPKTNANLAKIKECIRGIQGLSHEAIQYLNRD